jgi:hypothetical protein
MKVEEATKDFPFVISQFSFFISTRITHRSHCSLLAVRS